MYLFEILRTLKITLFKIIETNKIMSCSQLLYFDKMKTSYSQRLCYQHLLGQSFPNAIHFVDFCFNKKKHKRMFGNNKYLFPFVFSTAMSYNNFNISNAIWTIEISSVFTVDVPNIASLVFFLISILQYLKIDFVYFACKWLLVS